LEDLAEIAAEKGIHLYSIRVKRGRLEREFKPSNNVAVVGKINEIEAGVEGRQTRLVVKFFEPLDGWQQANLNTPLIWPRIGSRS
jgi:hypothetical protein